MRFKSFAVLLAIIAVLLPGCLFAASSVAPANSSRAVAHITPTMPLSFEPTGTPDRFLARSGRYAMLIGPNESSVAVSDNNSKSSRVFHFAFDKANAVASTEAVDLLPGVTNYYIGKDPQNWRVGVKNFAKLRTKQVYPGIDVVFYGDQRQLEFDFVVAPNADPKPIALNFSGTDKLYIDGGDLVAELGGESVRFVKPFAYQMVDGKRNPVSVEYALENSKAQLRLGDYDRERELVIDPQLSYSTYLGGSLADTAKGVAVDSTGNVYVTGQTCSTNFPSTGSSYVGSAGSCDAYVSKLSPNGATLLFTTFIAGQLPEPSNATASGNGIALDNQNPPYVYVVGTTNFRDIYVDPNPAGYPTTYNGGDSDAFIMILHSDSGARFRSTYLGGSYADAGYGIAVDSQRNVTVAGQTCSLDFPTYNGFVPMVESCAAFATKLDALLHIAPPIAPGTSALSPRYPSQSDSCGALCPANPASVNDNADGSGQFYFYSVLYNGQQLKMPMRTWPGGGTTNYRTGVVVPAGAITIGTPSGCPQNGQMPAQVLLAVGSGVLGTSNGLDWGDCSSLLKDSAVPDGGGFNWVILGRAPQTVADIPVDASSEGYGVALDPIGDAFIVGGTSSPDLTLVSKWSGTGPWILKVLGEDGSPVYMTALGTTEEHPEFVNAARAVAVDGSGQAYVTGTATGGVMTTSGSFHPGAFGGEDAFLIRLNTAGSAIQYGTYYGGTADDQGLGIAIDAGGWVYLTGSTESADLPLVNPILDASGNKLGQLRGTRDAFVAKLTPDGSSLVMSAFFGGSAGDYGNAIAVNQSSGDIYLAGNTSSVDFPVVGAIAGQSGASGNGDAWVSKISGASFPTASVTPATIDFGSQAVGFSSTTTHTVTIRNTSQAILSISRITTCADPSSASCTADNPEFITQNDCGSELTPAGGTKDNCTVTITFTPSAVGSRFGTLTVIDDAPDTPQSVGLTGKGTVVAATINPTNYDFGSVNVGTASSAHSFVVTNSDSSQNLIVGVPTVTTNGGGNDFSIPAGGNACTTIVAPGRTCTISVVFTPSLAGSRTGTLTLNGTGSTVLATAQLSGTGNGGGTVPSTAVLITTSGNSVSGSAGGSASFGVSLAQGQTDPVNLVCSTPNAGITCSPANTTISTSASTATFSLKIAGGTSGPKTASLHFDRNIFAAMILPFGLFGFVVVRKRRLMGVVLVLLLLAAVIFSASCSSTSKNVSGGSYQITVTGTGTSTVSGQAASQTVHVTLNVY